MAQTNASLTSSLPIQSPSLTRKRSSHGSSVLEKLRHFNEPRELGLSLLATLDFWRRSRRTKPGSEIELRVPSIGDIAIRKHTSDLPTLHTIYNKGAYHLDDYEQFKWIVARYARNLSDGKTNLIIDCGSNVGFTCIYWSQLFPAAKIIGIEAAADNASLAKRNTRTNANIELRHAAICDVETELSITDTFQSKDSYQVSEGLPANSVSRVATTTIPRLMREYEVDDALIVKVDIEGAEALLFRSNTEWVDHVALLIIELHDMMLPGKRSHEGFFHALRDRKFDFRHNKDNIFVFFHDR